MVRHHEVSMSRTRWSLQASLAFLVMFVTLSGFYASGFLSFKHDKDWHFGDPGSSLKTSSVSRKVASTQLKVGKAMEEIQVKLGQSPAESLEEALYQLRSEHKKSSILLLEVAATLDIVQTYLLIKDLHPSFQAMASNLPKPDSLNGTTSTNSTIEQQAIKTAAEQKSDPASVVRSETTKVDMADPMTGEDEEKEEGEWAEEDELQSEKDPLVEYFEIEEIKKYIRSKYNRLGRKNFMGANATYASIGHACVSKKFELEQYMEYDVGEYCSDDWPLGQKLMVHGCDPLPRRRCFVRGPKIYTKPLPINESLWKLPDDRNVRWDNYICKSFGCLAGPNRKGFFKCGECFDLQGHEKPKWTEVTNTSTDADFMLEEVLQMKPGEIRIGLDFSVGVGTFAARMREHNITVASATLNLGAPFNELIALRGLLPLYLSPNQRLPFFDNTLDIIHTTLFLDGWIDHQLLDFILFDWDRCLRPGGLLWIDRFFSKKEDMDDYLYYFEQLRYKRWKWVVTPKVDKDDGELWFSAVLEKPPRPF
ncbi:protein MpPMT.4 [Marchantia polymorpha subsp. ruderalis]